VAFNPSGHPEYLHHFVAEVVDDLDGDPVGPEFIEGVGSVAIEGGPGFFIALGFERGFERLVGGVGAQEVGLADEEDLSVVVGVDRRARGSDQSCSSLPRQTSCGSRSRLRRS
jgi:hypothetical protein